MMLFRHFETAGLTDIGDREEQQDRVVVLKGQSGLLMMLR